jgi:hypothetical protein
MEILKRQISSLSLVEAENFDLSRRLRECEIKVLEKEKDSSSLV